MLLDDARVGVYICSILLLTAVSFPGGPVLTSDPNISYCKSMILGGIFLIGTCRRWCSANS